MFARKFGQKIKTPSILSLKFQLVAMSLEEEIRAQPHNQIFNGAHSPALAKLRGLLQQDRSLSVKV